jgi:hypothetical protein
MRKRYVQIDGELVEVSRNWTAEPKSDYHVMPDIQGYQSMITGEWIGSRSTHRTHLRQHQVVEVGNEKLRNAPPKRTEWKSTVVDEFKRRGLLS